MVAQLPPSENVIHPFIHLLSIYVGTIHIDSVILLLLLSLESPEWFSVGATPAKVRFPLDNSWYSNCYQDDYRLHKDTGGSSSSRVPREFSIFPEPSHDNDEEDDDGIPHCGRLFESGPCRGFDDDDDGPTGR